jgi:dUTPase
VGDRIGQIIVEKLLDTEFEEVDTIEGNREGFGSTDVKKQ